MQPEAANSTRKWLSVKGLHFRKVASLAIPSALCGSQNFPELNFAVILLGLYF
jgi:hypothetical protein